MTLLLLLFVLAAADPPQFTKPHCLKLWEKCMAIRSSATKCDDEVSAQSNCPKPTPIKSSDYELVLTKENEETERETEVNVYNRNPRPKNSFEKMESFEKFSYEAKAPPKSKFTIDKKEAIGRYDNRRKPKPTKRYSESASVEYRRRPKPKPNPRPKKVYRRRSSSESAE